MFLSSFISTTNLFYISIASIIFLVLLVKYIYKFYNSYLETRLNTYTLNNNEIIPNQTYTATSAQEQPIYILWTGGFNSTFRLCLHILKFNESVQPIYIMENNSNGDIPNSTVQELLTMKQLRKYIINKYPHLQGHLLPTYYITNTHKNNNIEKNLKMKLKHEGLTAITYQYKTILKILQFDYGFNDNMNSKSVKLKIECCIHPDNIIYTRLLNLMEDDLIKTNLIFPFIDNRDDTVYSSMEKKTKNYNEMWNEARDMKFDDILYSTWSCINDKMKINDNDNACGQCSKCIERPFIHIHLNKKIRTEKDDA